MTSLAIVFVLLNTMSYIYSHYPFLTFVSYLQSYYYQHYYIIMKFSFASATFVALLVACAAPFAEAQGMFMFLAQMEEP